jgi:CheY-like chemotaxis protein
VGRDGPLQRALELGLVDSGFAVFSVRTALEAIGRSQNEPPAVVLAAPKLPDMEGTELRRRLSQDDRLREIPFVLMGDEPMLGDDGLVRPATLRELVARITILLPGEDEEAVPVPEPEDLPPAASTSPPVTPVTVPGELRPGTGAPPRVVRFPMPARKATPSPLHIAKTTTFDLPIHRSDEPTPPVMSVNEEVTAPSALPPPAASAAEGLEEGEGAPSSRPARVSALTYAAVVLVLAFAVLGVWMMRDGKAAPPATAAATPDAAAPAPAPAELVPAGPTPVPQQAPPSPAKR